jgi:hypothetical protein
VISLVVDIYTDGRGGAPNFKIVCHVSPISRLIAQFVDLLEQTLDALTHRFPLLLQAGKLLFQLGNVGGLFFYTMTETRSVLLNRKSEFALSFEQFNGAQYAFFECLKIVRGHGHLRRVFCECGHIPHYTKAGLRSQEKYSPQIRRLNKKEAHALP